MKPVKKQEKQKINPREMQKAYLENLEDDLAEKGVEFFDINTSLRVNSDYLSLPLHITEVSSRELGEYLNAFTQQKMYLRTLLSRTELMLEDARREYVTSSEVIYKALSNGKLSETAKERLINANDEVKPYYYEYVNWLKRKDLLTHNIASVEDAIFLISREVSRRNADFEEENRNYNVNR
jgi:hypothetical protein